jgi:dimeric dUTPase (all-alpha-NTP-PPase superfamily)
MNLEEAKIITKLELLTVDVIECANKEESFDYWNKCWDIALELQGLASKYKKLTLNKPLGV